MSGLKKEKYGSVSILGGRKMVKKIMNDPKNIVDEMLEGFVFAHKELQWFKEYRTVAMKKRKEKVGLVALGGSGHEPAHAGYIGEGMLDAVAVGNLFASPSPDQILKAIEEANTGRGVLVILKNYSGDLMNFSIAKELAEEESIRVESVVVKDDVAVQDSTYSTGRRGIAGTVFVHKIAGARAAEGAELEEVKAVAQKAIDHIRSLGISLGTCILPGLKKPGFYIGEDEIELGMGIHGEPGIRKMELKSSDELAEIMLNRILEDLDYRKREVAVLINGLGGTPQMELYVLAASLKKVFEKEEVVTYKVMVGNYMTSLEMAGCSVSLMELDEELKRLLDRPCMTPALCVE
jgi:dihydroxyacetone kinase-like protein